MYFPPKLTEVLRLWLPEAEFAIHHCLVTADRVSWEQGKAIGVVRMSVCLSCEPTALLNSIEFPYVYGSWH